MTPFDFIKDASHTQKNLMRGTENDKFAESEYDAHLTNKAFAMHLDTILMSNEMNMRYDLDNRPQYEFYLNILRPRKRFKKWPKKENDELLYMVCEQYGCNTRIGRQYLELLDDEQIKSIIDNQKTGG